MHNDPVNTYNSSIPYHYTHNDPSVPSPPLKNIGKFLVLFFLLVIVVTWINLILNHNKNLEMKRASYEQYHF
jgi:hypothetical protein